MENIVKVTGKKSGKAVKKTLKATITVKNPALSVKAAKEVAVGATEQITATVKPANTKVTYTSSDKEIATVDAKGVVTGVKDGDVTITVKAGKTTKTVKMAVKDAILKDVKQTTTTKLVATIAGNTANVKASDIIITNTYSKANYAVKSVSVDSTDKTQVTVETYVAMNDGKDYTVTLADVTKTITATDGKIVAATISPATVIVPTPANDSNGNNANDISAKFTDANGVEIATVAAGTQNLDGFAYVEWKVDATNNGYLSGKTLNLYKVGNTARVTVIAHTGKYNASAVEEGNVTAEATITGVAPEAVTITGWSVKLGTNADNKAGNAYIIVKDAKTKAVVTTLPVTVVAERKVTSLTLDKNAFTLSSSADIDKDVACKNANSKAPTDTITINKNEIKVNKPALVDDKDTSNTYIVEYKDVKVTFTIVVKKARTQATTYDLSLSSDKVDAVIKADATKKTTVTATVCGYDANGVKVSVVSDSAVTWTLQKDGKDVEDAAGVYTLKAKYDQKEFVKTFEVTNSQPAASASLTKTEVAKNTNLQDVLKVVYDGNDVKAADYSIVSSVTSISTTTNIDKVTVKIKLASNVYVEKELTIGKTIVVK